MANFIYHILIILLISSLFGGNADNKIIFPKKIIKEVQLDGILNEKVWEELDPINDFIQDESSLNIETFKETKVKMFYDNKYFYFGIILYTNGDDITYKQGRNDDFENTFYENSDYFIIEFDSFHDHASGFGFAVNSSGVKADYSMSDDEYYDDSWDGMWSASVSTNKNHWIIEYKIPINNLKFIDNENISMGINFTRYIYQDDQYISWADKAGYDDKVVSYFGHLKNINIHLEKELLLKPSLSISRFQYDDYYYSEYSFDDLQENITGLDKWINKKSENNFYNLGLDINYLIDSNSSLDITINPNFDYINQDPSEINNTAFETYYEENRPFFIDQSTFFFTPIELFYSRRLGQEALEYKDIYDNVEQYLSFNTSLDGAIKFLGRNNDLSYGIIGAQAKVHSNIGQNFEYSNNKAYYSIFRLKKNIVTIDSYIAFSNTNYNFRDEYSHVNSVDGLFSMLDGKLDFYYQVAESNINKKKGIGHNYEINYKSYPFNLGKMKVPFFVESWSKIESFDKNFNIDKTGYLYRNNYKNFHSGLSFNINQSTENFSNLSLVFQNIYSKNYFDVRLKDLSSFELNFELLNFSIFNIGVSKSRSSFLDRLYSDYFRIDEYTNISRNIKVPGERNYYINFETNSRKMLSFSIMFDYFKNSLNDDGKWYVANTRIKPNDWIDINISYDDLSYYKTYHFLKIKILGESGDTATEPSDKFYGDREDENYQFLFVNSNNREKVYTFKVSTQINKKLSLQFFGQYFRYSNNWLDEYYKFSNLSEDFSYPTEYPDYTPSNSLESDQLLYSAKYSSFKLNMTLSWEYRENHILTVGYNLNKDINGLIFTSPKYLLDYKSIREDDEGTNPEVWYDNTFFIKYDFILGF